ncbi:MAG: hypothetical protein OXP28_10625 [Gammaproteobacteria bacterium]|nr:hypothetical protein [Gammaproteobacteria bacterium]MDE0225579.1 hypothetical protein [Gammaproteobacteria bacterium]
MKELTVAAFCCLVATASVAAQHWALSASPPAAPPTIDLEDRRALAAGHDAALLGEITLNQTNAPDAASGEDVVGDPVPDNPGSRPKISLTVSGPLRQGDAVYLDLNANGAIDPGEGLWISPASGEASASFFLESPVPGSMAIHYVPNGNDIMERGEFVILATVAYGESSHADPDSLLWRTPLKYDGTSFPVILAPTANLDNQFRVTCDSGGPSCVVFVECRDRGQDADDYFAELHAIEDRKTVRMSQDDLAGIFGVRDWTEHLSCHVLSDDPVEIQVLTRRATPTIFNTPQSPPWRP